MKLYLPKSRHVEETGVKLPTLWLEVGVSAVKSLLYLGIDSVIEKVWLG